MYRVRSAESCLTAGKYEDAEGGYDEADIERYDSDEVCIQSAGGSSKNCISNWSSIMTWTETPASRRDTNRSRTTTMTITGSKRYVVGLVSGIDGLV